MSKTNWFESCSIFFIAFFFLPLTSFASEGSKSLLAAGVERLSAGDFEGAVNQFEFAVRADPSDAESQFFFGVAENRLGHATEALVRINQAKFLGFTHPNIPFETGYALLNLGQYDFAIKAIASKLAENPDDSELQYLAGRAYYGLGKLESAEAALKLARLNPRLADNANLLLASIDDSRMQDASGVESYFRDVLSRSPSTPLGAAIHEKASVGETGSPATPSKRWRAGIYAGAGYNDNVIALGDGVPLPGDISNEDSALFEGGFNIAYDIVRNESTTVSAGYGLSALKYEDELDNSDLLLHSVYIAARRKLDEQWSLTLIANNQFAQLGGDSFRNQFSLRPAAVYAHSSSTSVEAYVRVATEKYYFDSSRFTNRDGESYAGGVNLYSRIGETAWRYRAGVELARNQTDGSDFENDVTRYHTTLHGPLVGQLELRAGFSYSQRNYDTPNSFTGLSFNRDDEALGVNASLQHPVTLPIGGEQRLYLNYNYIDNSSNIVVYDYQQHSVTAGLIISF